MNQKMLRVARSHIRRRRPLIDLSVLDRANNMDARFEALTVLGVVS